MAVTPIIVGQNINMCRAYISGFVGSAGVTNMVYVGTVLHFDYLYPVITVDLQLKVAFFNPNSNFYTLDWIVDWTSSQVYVSGSPVSAGVGIKFVAMQTEPAWRVQILATLAIDETQRLDLQPVPNYWRPLA